MFQGFEFCCQSYCLKTSQELRMLSMSLSHEPWMSRLEFSNLSEIVNQVDSATVSIFVVILVELTNTVFVNSTNITTNIETAVLSNSNCWRSHVKTCWCCWYWCWEQIDARCADISKLKFERLEFLKQDIGQDCGHKVWSGHWSWSLIEILKLNFWGWCLVYILKLKKLGRNSEIYVRTCDMIQKKVLWESTQPFNSVFPFAMFSSLSHTNDLSQRDLSLIEINFRPLHLHLKVFVECFH